MRLIERAKDVISSIVGTVIPDYKHVFFNPSSWVNINTGQTSDNSDYLVNRIIDQIAKDMSMTEAKYLINGLPQKHHEYTYALNVQANVFQTASDFMYQVITLLYTNNDVFIQYERLTNQFIVLNLKSIQFAIDSKHVYLFGECEDGFVRRYNYDNVIHLRYRPKSIYFSATNDDISTLLNIVNRATKEQLRDLAHSKNIKGLLKIPGALSKEHRKEKVEDFMSAIDRDIGVVDNQSEFIELKNNYSIDYSKFKDVRKEIYTFFGISEEIITCNYTEAQYNAYKRSTLEPLAEKLSQAFTSVLFKKWESKDAWQTLDKTKTIHEIVFDFNNVKLASLQQQSAYINTLMVTGVATLNEVRDYINLPPVEGGDKNRVSLNNVETEVATNYQLTNASDNTSINDIEGGEKNEKDT